MDEAAALPEARVGSVTKEWSPLGRGPAGRGPRPLTWVIRAIFLAGVAGIAVHFRDRLPNPKAMWTMAAKADPGWLSLAFIAEALSMGAFARLQRRLLRTGGIRMSLPRAFAVTYAGNALSTTLPAGAAVSVAYSFRQFRRSGASTHVATAVILLGGIATTSAYSIVGLLALLGEPRSRLPAAAVLTVIAVTMTLLRFSPGFRRVLSTFMQRILRTALQERHLAPLARSLHRARGIVRFDRRDWALIATFAALNWIFEILTLIAAIRALGITLAAHQITLAYFAAQAAGSALPWLPGGLGAIEAGLVSTLVAFGASTVPASAAVSIYRMVSFWGVVTVGWLAWLILRASDETLHTARRRLRNGWCSASTSLAALAWPATPVWACPSAGNGAHRDGRAGNEHVTDEAVVDVDESM